MKGYHVRRRAAGETDHGAAPPICSRGSNERRSGATRGDFPNWRGLFSAGSLDGGR